MATSFRIESTIQGHHVFKEIWTPLINENLEVSADVFDVHAVAVWKSGQAVGHVPRELSSAFWYFLHRRNSKIMCKITGGRHRSEIPGKGLVVPCIYIFEGKQNHIEKLMTVLATIKETE